MTGDSILANLEISDDGQLYWKKKKVKTEVKLSFAQKFWAISLAAITAISMLCGAANDLVSLNKELCFIEGRIGCHPAVAPDMR